MTITEMPQGCSIASHRDSRWRAGIAPLIAFLLTFSLSDIGLAQTDGDIVITRRAGSDSVKRGGKIVEWKGASLTLNTTARNREIDNDEIVEIQTQWSEDYHSGITELKIGKTQIGIVKLQEALRNESRPWAKRIIRSHLVDGFMSIEKHADAVEQFLQIIREDPYTRFINITPLPWTGSTHSLDRPARKWIESNDSLTQLIGASWLLGGTDRDKAIVILEQLTKDFDAGIRNLAIAQLWRVRATANPKQIAVWQGIVEKMPRSLRAGPYFVLSEAQSRVDQVDDALVNLMRIPIQYPQQRTLAAAALYRTARLLHNRGQAGRAQSVLNELVTKYPQTIWADQAAPSELNPSKQ